MTQVELATRMGRPKKTINELIKGKIALTHETALQLERVLGVPAYFWNNLETQYRADLARVREVERLLEANEWLNEVPWLEMDELGWLEDFTSTEELITAVLGYFEVATPEAYHRVWIKPQGGYRKPDGLEVNPHALAAWLRQGEIQSAKIDCPPFDQGGFHRALNEIRGLTIQAPHVYQAVLQEMCRKQGVLVMLVPELPGSKATIATYWSRRGRPLIQMGSHFETTADFWLAFFHAAAHILLHG